MTEPFDKEEAMMAFKPIERDMIALFPVTPDPVFVLLWKQSTDIDHFARSVMANLFPTEEALIAAIGKIHENIWREMESKKAEENYDREMRLKFGGRIAMAHQYLIFRIDNQAWEDLANGKINETRYNKLNALIDAQVDINNLLEQYLEDIDDIRECKQKLVDSMWEERTHRNALNRLIEKR